MDELSESLPLSLSLPPSPHPPSPLPPSLHFSIPPPVSRHYVRTTKGVLENTPYVDLSYKWAGGGYLSNAEDLVKFGNAVLTSLQLGECMCVGLVKMWVRGRRF